MSRGAIGETVSVGVALPDEPATPVGPILGRGSAAGFPPVTAERTQPAVPPFHGRRSPQTAPLSTNSPSVSFELPEPSPRSLSGGAAAAGSPDSRLPPSDGHGFTPKFPGLGPDATQQISISSEPWPSRHDDPSVGDASAETREAPVLPLSAGTSKLGGEAPHSGTERSQTRSSWVAPLSSPLPGPHGQPAKRAIPLVAAASFALLFGGVGFGSGYVLGSSQTNHSSAPVSSTISAPVDNVRNFAPAPPPPPPESVQGRAGENDLERTSSRAVDTPIGGSQMRKTSDPTASEGQTRGSAANEQQRVPDRLGGLSMGVGPGPVAGSGAERSESDTGLEAAAIQATVQKNQNAVKRSCWQPALNGRPADAPSTARVTTTIQISPAGAVTSVRHSGDPRGYPGLGACIVGRLKTWTFPRSSGTTTANIPFVFAAQ